MYDICQTSADRACTLLLSRMVRRLVTNSRFDTFSLVLSKKTYIQFFVVKLNDQSYYTQDKTNKFSEKEITLL